MNLPDGWSTETVSVNGIDIQYYRRGQGQPIVLAHGMYDNGRRWVPLADELADEYDIITYDARGHGRSDAPETGYDIDNRVADLVGVVRALSLTNPILLGHSMGGATAAWTAATHPELVGGLALADPARFRESPEIPLKQAEELTREKLADSQSRPVAERVEEQVDAHDIDAEQARRFVVATDECSPQIFRLTQEHDPVVDAVEEIQTPTLILRRDMDVADRVADLQAIEEASTVRLVHVPDAGHYVFRDAPDAAATELRTFLSRL